MKYIKTYKIFEGVKIKPKSAWIIYGGKKIIIDILYKIEKQLYYSDMIAKTDMTKSIRETIVRINDCDIWFKNLGFILYYSNYGFSFSVIVDENEKEKMLKHIDNSDDAYKFKGELKIENDELVLDTIEIDVKNYNL